MAHLPAAHIMVPNAGGMSHGLQPVVPQPTSGAGATQAPPQHLVPAEQSVPSSMQAASGTSFGLPAAPPDAEPPDASAPPLDAPPAPVVPPVAVPEPDPPSDWEFSKT
jgi:hypothetical protein